MNVFLYSLSVKVARTDEVFALLCPHDERQHISRSRRRCYSYIGMVRYDVAAMT
jgi:hypothetical protein